MQDRPQQNEIEEGVYEGTERPWLVNLLGKPVIVNYMRGPFPRSPWRIEKGAPDARGGLFVLTEVSDWGVVVKKVLESGELNTSVFISWGSLHTIQDAAFLTRAKGFAEEEEEEAEW